MREGEATLLIGVPRLYDALFSGIADRIAPWDAARRLLDAVLRAVGWVRKTTGRSPGRPLFRPIHDQFAPRLRIMASGGAPLDPELGWKLEALGWPDPKNGKDGFSGVFGGFSFPRCDNGRRQRWFFAYCTEIPGANG